MNEENCKGYQRRGLDSNKIHYAKTIIKSWSMVLFIAVMILKLSFLVEVVYILQKTTNEDLQSKPKYKMLPEILNFKFNYHKHLHSVLEKVGYDLDSDTAQWDLLWSHNAINFSSSTFKQLLPHQKLNQVPGTSFMENKKALGFLNSKYIPKSFVLPKQKAEFLTYAKNKKNSLFLQKKASHRGIRMINVSDVNMLSEQYFIQEYVQDPLLVDGHKFDIGVYVVITSMSPLRAYWYKSDAMFRYCPSKYYPFNEMDVNKYVVTDHYRPTWEVPSLAESFSSLGHGMKDSFDTYIKSKGIKPVRLWLQIQKAIAQILLINGRFIRKEAKKFPSQDNYFELVRFDFIVKDNLDVYLLEINLSPNISSGRYPKNAELFKQLLYNLFLLTGVAYKSTELRDMVSSQRDIAVFGEDCREICFGDCKVSIICKLCEHCHTEKLKKSLLKAHAEFLHRGDFRRIVPPSEYTIPLKRLSYIDRLQYLWYKEKCTQDVTWCT